jgi:hypothetical protein
MFTKAKQMYAYISLYLFMSNQLKAIPPLQTTPEPSHLNLKATDH